MSLYKDREYYVDISTTLKEPIKAINRRISELKNEDKINPNIMYPKNNFLDNLKINECNYHKDVKVGDKRRYCCIQNTK